MDLTCSLQCGWAALHLIGLAATFFVRAYAGSKAEPLLQGMYLFCLSGVGLATLAGEQFGWHLWIVSAFTMGVMAVAALADFSAHEFEPHG